MLEQKVKNLFNNNKESLSSEFDVTVLNSSAEDKTIQVMLEDVKDSTVNSVLLNTHSSSIATTMLQEKIDKLEKEKKALLSSQVLLNNYTDSKENTHYQDLLKTDKVEKFEIKEMNEFSYQHNDYYRNKPSFVSNIPESS